MSVKTNVFLKMASLVASKDLTLHVLVAHSSPCETLNSFTYFLALSIPAAEAGALETFIEGCPSVEKYWKSYPTQSGYPTPITDRRIFLVSDVYHELVNDLLHVAIPRKAVKAAWGCSVSRKRWSTFKMLAQCHSKSLLHIML